MKVLISHSWKDKTLADRLAHDLEGVAEVWIDTQQLIPGEPIQPNIDEAIETVDAMLLLWSSHAAASANVGAEVDSAVRLERRIIPCRLDDTPLPDAVSGRLAVDFADYGSGFLRLNVTFMRWMAPELGIGDDPTLAVIKDYDGLLDYLENYRNRHGIEGDKAHWINRVLTKLDAVNSHGQAMLDRMQRAAEFSQRVMAAARDRATDRAALEALLAEAESNEDLEPAAKRTVLRLLRICIEEAPAGDKEASATDADEDAQGAEYDGGYGDDDERYPADETPTRAPGARPAFDDGGRGPHGAPGDPRVDRDHIAARLRAFVPPMLLGQAVDAVCYYLEAARPVLDTLDAFARQLQSPAGSMVVSALRDYLDNPNDLLPEAQLGAWGRIDDAWLIHNTAYRLIEAGLLPAVGFAVDWNRIVLGDRIVLNAMGPGLHFPLQQHLVHYMNLVAQEVHAYRPQFEHGGRGYAAHMPYSREVERAADSLFTEAQLGAWNAEGWE